MGSFPNFAQMLRNHHRVDFSPLLISEAKVCCWIVNISDVFLSISSIEDELSNGSVMASSRLELDDAAVAVMMKFLRVLLTQFFTLGVASSFVTWRYCVIVHVSLLSKICKRWRVRPQGSGTKRYVVAGVWSRPCLSPGFLNLGHVFEKEYWCGVTGATETTTKIPRH